MGTEHGFGDLVLRGFGPRATVHAGVRAGEAVALKVLRAKLPRRTRAEVERELGRLASLRGRVSVLVADGVEDLGRRMRAGIEHRDEVGAVLGRAVDLSIGVDARVVTVRRDRVVQVCRWPAPVPLRYDDVALDALRAAYCDDQRPRAKQSGGAIPVISVLGNGEDLSSSPDALMVGWALEKNVPRDIGHLCTAG